MYFRPGISLPVALLAVTAHGSPIPQDAIVDGFSQSDVTQICAITYDNPAKAWDNSGASIFLDHWIAANGSTNWSNNIEQQTTAQGSQGTSNLDCTDLLGGNCAYPSIQCKFFTPPALFHVRNAMATCYSMFSAFHENLQDNTILTSLNIGNILSDMGLSQVDSGIN